MASEKGRPLIIIPMGLRAWFMREACPKGVTLLAEVREVDPTCPGFPEFEEMIGGDIDLPEEPPEPPQRPRLRLAALNGLRLDR